MKINWFPGHMNSALLMMEKELKNVLSGLPTNTSEESKKIDFGFGPSVPLNSQYLSQGIMVW